MFFFQFYKKIYSNILYMDVHIRLIDEISMVCFWVGLSGLLDKIITHSLVKQSSAYIYILLILFAIYVNL
jgi:hypothetical protein